MEFSTDVDANHKIIEVPDPKHSRPLWQKLLFLVIFVGILSLVVFGISTLLNKKSSPSAKKATEQTDTRESTTSAQPKSQRCNPKQDLNNSKQGYQACFEAFWKQKEIKPSGLEIGLSGEEITENFPGTINIAISDKTEELFTQDISNSSSKFEFGKVNVDGKKSTQLVITRSRDDSLIAYPRAIITATSTNNRTYIFTLNSTESDFAADTEIYEEFLQTIKFLEKTANPPWSDSRNILVEQPWVGDSIISPVTISGQALSFEAVVNVRIKDNNGKIITETTLKTGSGTERSAFSGNISFDKPKTNTGTIEVFNTSAKDGEDQDKVILPVKFQ